MGNDEEEWIPIVIKMLSTPRGFKKNPDGSCSYTGFKTNKVSYEDINMAFDDAEKGKGRFKSGRGRKAGSGKIPLTHIKGIVDEAIEKGEAKNKNDAFLNFGCKEGYEIDSDNAKNQYYKAEKLCAPQVEIIEGDRAIEYLEYLRGDYDVFSE